MRVKGAIGRWIASAAALSVLALPAAAEAKRNLYVTGQGSSAVAAFDFSAAGAIQPVTGSPFMNGANPNGVALTPDGRRLYTANFGGSNSSGFEVASAGALSPLPGSPFAAGTNPDVVAVAPDGAHLYLTDTGAPEGVFGLTINADGSLSPITGSPFTAGTTPLGMAIAPDDRHLYAANFTGNDVSGFTINANGTLTPVGAAVSTGGATPIAAAVTPDGKTLFVANQGTDTIAAFQIAADGTLAPVSGSPFPAGDTPSGLAVAPDGAHLYVMNTAPGTVSAFAIAAGGALSALTGSPFTAATGMTAGAVTPNGRRLYAANANDSNVYGFEIATGGGLSPLTGSPFVTGIANPNFNSVAVSPNQGPTASFTATPGAAGLATGFNAGASSDSDGSVARFDWDFGDGATLADGGPTPSHTYTTAGTFTATLTVMDDEGCSASFVYTGQTASCNGTAAAKATQEVKVADVTPPVLGLKAKHNQPAGAAVKLSVSCSEACTVAAVGNLVVRVPGGRGRAAARRQVFKLRKAVATLPANTSQVLKLALPPRARKAFTKLGARVGTASIAAAAADVAGNRATDNAVVVLRRKRRR